MKVGVQLFPGTPRDAVDSAARCEALGFSSVWVADHYTGGGRNADWVVPELFTTLAAMAGATSTIRLGSCVASVSKRSAADIAHAALTLAALAEGRFILGLGAGFGPDSKPFGVALDHPASRCSEAIEVIRGLWGSSPQQTFSFEGRWHTLDGAFLNLPATPLPPILLAAQGPKMMAITETMSDGWLPFALSPETYGEFLARMPQRGGDFRPMLWLPTFLETGGADRSTEAIETGRMYLSMAPAILAAAMAGAPAAVGTSDWNKETAAEVAAQVPPDLALSVTLHGDPQGCVETLGRFAAAGCEEVVLRITDPDARGRDIETFAQEVLPWI